MEFHLKQWRDQQHESDEQEPSAKLPRLLFDPNPQQLPPPSGSSAVPLFSPEPSIKLSNLSAYVPDSTTTTSTKLPRMGSYFSLAQWQELELQALIFRHMLAGASIPPELLNLVKKSLLNSPPPYYFPHHLQPFTHFRPGLLQPGYWGRAAMDPEPGRCRRTDGKKWRCSRDVVVGQKYCERHVHRGRNRSRKPVEAPTPSTVSTGNAGGGGTNGIGILKTNNHPMAPQPLTSMSGGTHFALSEPSSSIDLLHLNQRTLEPETENKGLLFRSPNEVSEDNKSGGQILRHFFDDWPRSVQEPDKTRNNASLVTSATNLSISFPGDSSSDFSLKLSTGNNIDGAAGGGSQQEGSSTEGERPQLNWAAAWGTNQQVSSMGGPLAEALRSSASKSSPTSVLHQPPRGSMSVASYISTCI